MSLSQIWVVQGDFLGEFSQAAKNQMFSRKDLPFSKGFLESDRSKNGQFDDIL